MKWANGNTKFVKNRKDVEIWRSGRRRKDTRRETRWVNRAMSKNEGNEEEKLGGGKGLLEWIQGRQTGNNHGIQRKNTRKYDMIPDEEFTLSFRHVFGDDLWWKNGAFVVRGRSGHPNRARQLWSILHTCKICFFLFMRFSNTNWMRWCKNIWHIEGGSRLFSSLKIFNECRICHILYWKVEFTVCSLYFWAMENNA